MLQQKLDLKLNILYICSYPQMSCNLSVQQVRDLLVSDACRSLLNPFS